jgi:hypothetical protein
MQEKNTTPPLPTNNLFKSQIPGTEYIDIQLKSTGKVFFGIHHFEDDEDRTNTGFYIREEVGIAATILPDGFQKERFESVKDAKQYCFDHFSKLIQECHG